jgi:hypothetical protein
MSFEREDFYKSLKPKNSPIPQLLAVAAIAPKISALTHDENWNSYISYLSGIRGKLDSARLIAQEKMGDPSLVNGDEIMHQKITMLINEAQIQMIDLAIDLPRSLLESAKVAKELIRKFEEKNETAINS